MDPSKDAKDSQADHTDHKECLEGFDVVFILCLTSSVHLSQCIGVVDDGMALFSFHQAFSPEHHMFDWHISTLR